jgi:hypothetical protein
VAGPPLITIAAAPLVGDSYVIDLGIARNNLDLRYLYLLTQHF